MNRDEERFVALWTDYLEGDVDEAGMAELRQLVDNNPEYAKLAADTFRTHRLLGMLGQEKNWQQDAFIRETMAMLPDADNPFVEDVMKQLPASKSTRPRPFNWPLLVACAAALVIAGSFIWQMGQLSPQTIATITAMDGDVRWTGDGGIQQDVNVGTELYGGVMETLTHDSWIECTFEDGTKVTITGNALVTLSEFERQKTVYLREGNLSADVAKQPIGKPMRVLTRTAEAEVLGTQFVLSSAPQESQMTVNEGLVRVKRLADGSVEDVGANQSIVAALEQGTDFTATKRESAVYEWAAVYPKDIGYGKPGQKDGQSHLVATPLLWEEGRDEPLLLHVGASQPYREGSAPLLMNENTRLRVTGTVASETDVIVGITALHPKGGFAGKYKTSRKVVPKDASGDHPFTIETSIMDMRKEKERFPDNAAGLQVFDCWVLTIHHDHDLRIHSVDFYQAK